VNDLALGFAEALRLLGGGDPELWSIILRTLAISGVATLLAMLVGVPLGYAIARGRFPGRTVLLALVNTGMGMPPVVVGLVVWLLLTRSGPLGGLELIYTRRAMVLAQFLIATPLVVGFTAASVQSREAKLGLLAAVMAGFGAIVSEVGASMTVGGNLRGSTRVLTTAIVTETSRGNLPVALALGLVLLLLAFLVNLLLTVLQQRRTR
jgi:tungstate transport system permease protein